MTAIVTVVAAHSAAVEVDPGDSVTDLHAAADDGALGNRGRRRPPTRDRYLEFSESTK